MISKRSSNRSLGLGVVFGVTYAIGNEPVRAIVVGALVLSAAWWSITLGWRLLRLSRSISASVRRLEEGE